MKRIATTVVLLVLIAIGLMLSRASVLKAPARSEVPRVAISLDEPGAVERLAGAVRIPTVSIRDEAGDDRPFLALHRYLERQYPLVHARLQRQIIGKRSLLFTWQGVVFARPPIVLMAHLDVVPAGTEGATWQHPPFAGVSDEQFIHGRGTLDDKGAVIAVLEAVEKSPDIDLAYPTARRFDHAVEGPALSVTAGCLSFGPANSRSGSEQGRERL